MLRARTNVAVVPRLVVAEVDFFVIRLLVHALGSIFGRLGLGFSLSSSGGSLLLLTVGFVRGLGESGNIQS